MAMTFPNIQHFNDVLPAIKGRDEFIVGRRNPHFDFVAYYIMASDTFKHDDALIAALRRECRGLIFHKDGTVARRAFHKFFNVGENEETMPDNLNLSEGFSIFHKLDGSMIAPFVSKLDDQVYWASMRGSYDFHEMLKPNFSGGHYEEFVRDMAAKNLTGIFEFCSQMNRIVVNYPETTMTLLAVRHKITGEYLDRNEVCRLGQKYSIPIVEVYSHEANDIQGLMQEIADVENLEGAVIWMKDGRLAKLKGNWYSQLHKLLAHFDFEKDIARLILSGNQDDLLGLLSADKKQKLLDYQEALMAGIQSIVEQCNAARDAILSGNLTRKEFATDYQASMVVKGPIFKNFEALSQASFLPNIVENALSKTSSQGAWDKYKHMAGFDLSWLVAEEI